MKGRPVDLIRWTLEMAGREFGIDRKTVAGRIRQSGALPGADGKFTTKDIASALFGDLEFEKIRKCKAEADQIEMEMAKSRLEFIEVADFTRCYEEVLTSCVRVIRSSKLSVADQDEILLALAKLHQ